MGKSKILLISIVSILILILTISILIKVYITNRTTPFEMTDLGPISINGDYVLMESRSQSNKYIITYNIVLSSVDLDILYTTPQWFPGFFRVEGMWDLKNNDFFILSSDIGLYLYKFENETWLDSYEIYIAVDENANEYAYLVDEREVNSLNIIEYDINNIPIKVLEYLRKWS